MPNTPTHLKPPLVSTSSKHEPAPDIFKDVSGPEIEITFLKFLERMKREP